MKKKMLSLVLAVAIIVSVISTIAVSAVVSEIIARTTADLTVDQTWANPGDTVDVNVSVAENPGIMGATLTVSWDETLTLVKATSGEVFSDMTYTPPSRYNPMGTSFVWYRNAVGNVMDGVVLTLTFQVPETATINSIQPICVTYTEGDVFNSNEKDVTLSITDGYVQIIDYIPGDVTGDGRVNTRDLVRLSQYISDGCKTDPEGYNAQAKEEACDVTGDGKINAKDLIRLSQYISDGNRTNPNGYNAVLRPAPPPECKHTNMVATEANAATCTEDGNIAYWYCGDCDKYFSDAEATNEILLADTVQNATGHPYAADWSYDENYHWHDVTCQHNDLTDDFGEHSFVDHRCPVCQATETVIVTFVDYDGSVIDIQQVPYSSAATAPSEIPEPAGYVFDGWNTSFDVITEELTVEAQYTQAHTVTFVDYDGTVLKQEAVRTGGSATAYSFVPSDLPPEGYKRTGWDKTFDNVTEDMTVYATYEKIVYTVKFYMPDGSLIDTKTVEHGADVEEPAHDEHYFNWNNYRMYGFSGWNDPQRGITGWSDPLKNIVDNTSIYAQYEANYLQPVISIDTTGNTASAKLYLPKDYYVYAIDFGFKWDEAISVSDYIKNSASNLYKDQDGSAIDYSNKYNEFYYKWTNAAGVGVSGEANYMSIVDIHFATDGQITVNKDRLQMFSDCVIMYGSEQNANLNDLETITPIIVIK